MTKKISRRKAVRVGGRDRFRQYSTKKVVARHRGKRLTLESPEGLENIARAYLDLYTAKAKDQLFAALGLLEHFDVREFDHHKITFNDVSFRATNTKLPLSIIGSKLFGGRFNIGSPQLIPGESRIGLFPALYSASTTKCAIAESGCFSPTQVSVYKIRPKKELVIVDLAKLVTVSSFQNLKIQLGSRPIGAAWGTQKFPMSPQIIGLLAKSSGYDGVTYQSAIDPKENIYAFFFENSVDSAHDLFECEKA